MAHCEQGFTANIPLEVLMDDDVLLAYRFEGKELEPEHGYPLRLLVPGVYGMKNVKWVTIVELVDRPFRGYWEQRGWSDAAVVKTTSRIDVPRRGMVRRAEATRMAGIAFAGDRGIAKVEVSDDDGATWQTATLRTPQGPFAWVFWEAPWQPEPGYHRLLVRATDGTGALQSPAASPTLPDGASGYHQVDVRVV
jgi:hypothetical protein